MIDKQILCVMTCVSTGCNIEPEITPILKEFIIWWEILYWYASESLETS